MRPNVIEVRQNWLAWMFRADYTSGRWKYIVGLPHNVPFERDVIRLRRDLLNGEVGV